MFEEIQWNTLVVTIIPEDEDKEEIQNATQ